ncbi:hypothetical protein GOODEAATRI_011967 [Goodea atripinnis]|uniref:Uncharacterized protein n=1 Tax=Goodea atripinnis TaxID=208336 RepID=A0ABV0PMW9_9TELE
MGVAGSPIEQTEGLMELDQVDDQGRRWRRFSISGHEYIVGTLDLMVSENYVLVYLCAMAPRNKLPAIKWLNQCYTSIDRRYDGFYQQGPLANGAISQIFN